MSSDKEIFQSGFTRRGFISALGIAGAALAAPAAAAAASDSGASGNSSSKAQGQSDKLDGLAGDPISTPPVLGLHLQLGSDASRTMVASWHSVQPVTSPRVLLGDENGQYLKSFSAQTRTYLDAKSNVTVYAHHASIDGLDAETDYTYAAIHEGAEPVFGSFLTAPRGRVGFTFTSFGDQGTPTLGKTITPTPGASAIYVNDNLGSPAAADTTAGVERVQPLFHLFNGDLCYANLATDRVRTWFDFWDNNSRSARNRPWMPSAGNHENELGNGPIGYAAYQTYFELPPTEGQTDVTRGLWYAFTVGAVRVLSLANDDVTYQDAGNSYVRGYSQGAQKAWLESELAAARSNSDIDWIIVCMHQVAISTANQFNGADLGIREEWVPLFDQYGVDLVVCGHEHHYERSHPLRGATANQTLTPIPVSTETDVVRTDEGTVHMVIGGGGTSAPSNQLFFNPPACRVIVAVGDPDASTGKRPPVYVQENAPWSAVRNVAHSYGFASFVVDPGTQQEGITRITVTYYDVVGTSGQLAPFEVFTLERPRSDAS